MLTSRSPHPSRFWLSALALAAGALLLPPAAAAARAAKAPPARLLKLSLSPPSGTLTGPEARQTLVVNAHYSDGTVRYVT